MFSRVKQIERFVELGPAAVLTNMAKKTQKSSYQTLDSLLGLQRSFISSVQDIPQVRYHYAVRESIEDASSDGVRGNSSTEISNPVVEQVQHAVARVPTATVAAPSIADVSMSALQIILTLVAFKLKKSINKISTRQSIKELSFGKHGSSNSGCALILPSDKIAGKSTLQNELIGDLTDQFGFIPDRAEDMPLAVLAESLEPENSGQLSQAFYEIIGRWILSVMPPKFNLSAMRHYLNQTWGLGPSRQIHVIAFAMTQTVADTIGRLSSVKAANDVLDAAVASYAEYCRLTLTKASMLAREQVVPAAINQEILEKVTQDQRLLAKLQHKALTRYLGLDYSNESKLTALEDLHDNQFDRLALWMSEYGTEFEEAIRPKFNSHHLRRFNFWWNQTRIDLCSLYYDATLQDALLSCPSADLLKSNRLRQIANRSSPRTLDLLTDMVASSLINEDYSRFTVIGRTLTNMIQVNLSQPPRASFPCMTSAPRTTVEHDGSTRYTEVPRIISGFAAPYTQALRDGEHAALRTRVRGHWHINSKLTTRLFENISKAQRGGFSFSNKVVLITGAGHGSIGAELVRKLLMGGATVIVTTSRAISEAQEFYRMIYSEFGARHSELFVLPFNQASVKDCRDLIEYVYSESGLGQTIDILIPFAAIVEDGAEIDQLAPKSELAHRLMLTNVCRLIGFVVRQNTERNIHFHPTQVLLPLSPNHGTFGGDGLYSESKLGLESILNRFASESWRDKVSTCGVIIGWTRGTGLMESNDNIAQAIESHGVLTFSQEEMALNILSLLAPEITAFCEDEAILADFGGGLQQLQDLKTIMIEERRKIRQEQQCNKAILEEDARERALIDGHSKTLSNAEPLASTIRRSKIKIDFPALPNYDRDLKSLQDLEGMVDLSSTVVIVGYSELGPWGNSRTRWQIESQRTFSQDGYIEMAWMMGLIKHFNGEHKSGGHYVGWVDAQSGEIVQDDQVGERYNKHILNHAGIRLIEPEILGGYDPLNKEYLQEIAIEDDLPEFECTRATAEAFKKKHGDRITIQASEESDTVRVQIKAGAHIMVPKIEPLASSVVAGLLPTGWSAARYGIPDDIISQVDKVTLYTLCCVAEAFLSAGIEKPQEVFKNIHLSEIGNFIGSSLGGTDKNREMFHDVRLNKRVQGDIFQETNLNTPAAWVNMLLLGSSGPIKTPVGACATSLESLDIGVDSILCGKTKMCLVGGVDNFQEDESYAFSTMKATVDATKQFAEGRQPAEFSRPTAETRAGFLEAQGCGIQIICNAEIALEMGLPIYAVIAGSAMAADKISRSVPAPGKGLLTFARESKGAGDSPLLNIKYRRAQMQSSIFRATTEVKGSNSDRSNTISSVSSSSTPASLVSDHLHHPNDTVTSGPCAASLLEQAMNVAEATSAESIDLSTTIAPADAISIKHIRLQWGNQFRAQDPQISPMRASLAVFGLTINDISIVSLHGTSTKANDINEPETINQQMTHLGRKGPPIIAICQKSVTGHPKAPAAAWMLNGCLQALQFGLVPGNYHCDNIDPALEHFEHLVFPTEPTRIGDIKAFLLSSFGFGQKGAQMVGVSPKYLFATLERDAFDKYALKCAQRARLTNRAFAQAVMSNSIFKAQAQPPYSEEDEAKVLLDPLARGCTNTETGQIYFDPTNPHSDYNGVF